MADDPREVSVLSERLKSLTDTVNSMREGFGDWCSKIENKLEQIVQIDRSIADLQAHKIQNETDKINQKKEMDKMWSQIDMLKKLVYIAMGGVIIVGGLLKLGSTGADWLVSHQVESEKLNSVQEQRIEQLEKALKK